MWFNNFLNNVRQIQNRIIFNSVLICKRVFECGSQLHAFNDWQRAHYEVMFWSLPLKGKDLRSSLPLSNVLLKRVQLMIFLMHKYSRSKCCDSRSQSFKTYDGTFINKARSAFKNTFPLNYVLINSISISQAVPFLSRALIMTALANIKLLTYVLWKPLEWAFNGKYLLWGCIGPKSSLQFEVKLFVQ